jgi:hypothetical protein
MAGSAGPADGGLRHLDHPAAALGQFFDLFGEHCHLGDEPLAEDGAHDADVLDDELAPRVALVIRQRVRT